MVPLVVKSDGTIYCTDPTYGRMPGFGVEREEDLDFRGVDRHPPGGGELEWTGGAELVLGGGPARSRRPVLLALGPHGGHRVWRMSEALEC